MPKQTPNAVAKKWLERAEEGETEAQIARLESKDLRTVKGAIERVRRERDLAFVRRDTLRDSYRRHLDELLGMLDVLNGIVGPPPDDLPLNYPGSQQPEEWSLCSCKVICTGTRDTEVMCPVEEKLIFSLLKEHLKGDQLWRHFDAWKTQLGQMVESYLRLSERTKTRLEKITGLRISTGDQKEHHITPEGAHLIYRFALQEALKRKRVLAEEANITLEDGDDGLVLCYEDGVTWTLGRGPGLSGRLLETLRELSGDTEVARIRNTRVKMGEAARQIKEIIELIRAGWHVPGKCRACERMKQ